MRVTRAVVPSLFTVLNIFCGFLSVVHTSTGDFVLASWFIVLAALFDTLDGVMARITKSSSNFGIEFDSLSDVVSFGVAPSFLAYNVYLHTQEGFGMLVSAMPMIFGALRLARFNSQIVNSDKDYFKGLPIPAAAITICSYVLTFSQDGSGLTGLEASLLVPTIVIVSLLMVSNLKYDAVPKFSKRGIKQHPLRFTVGVIGMTTIVVTKGAALFPFFVFYVATGAVRYIIHFIHHSLHPTGKTLDENSTEVSSVDV
jgi:CDP-diacylglycerol--serine O-phosphatidyltransferase